MNTNETKIDSPNFQYIDCTSGIQHLINLQDPKEDQPFRQYEEFKRARQIFQRCFFNGAVTSRCTRNIISTEVFLKNVTDAINECRNFVIYPYLSIIIEAALRGVWDNCSLGQDNHYLPKVEETVEV
jgi:hypothetical protein